MCCDLSSLPYHNCNCSICMFVRLRKMSTSKTSIVLYCLIRKGVLFNLLFVLTNDIEPAKERKLAMSYPHLYTRVMLSGKMYSSDSVALKSDISEAHMQSVQKAVSHIVTCCFTDHCNVRRTTKPRAQQNG